ncbi:Zinc finger CCCH domain-containing protein 19 [Striga hermonthica]|uniref:Zinc finger CCCH domain-containing protein 19 n=1 Tax=Striga hermonthica TaxID=68872 RepID=A0A9N7NNB3_STRHE|nr:Zinc finger CCCH domain-containing protein 19 [Striga hermonthica]
MENIETLLAAVAQTQGFDDDEPAVKAGAGGGLEKSEAPAVGRDGSGDARPSAAADVAPPAPILEPAPPPLAVPVIAAAVEGKKRGRPKGYLAAKPPAPKRTRPEDEEEDVCFICFDGGSLVLCDRKGCPKAYHPACIKRDEAFFQSKAKWNCGWHICSVCRKASHYLCYTCTYSLCKGCIKDADYVCVRGNKGFCTICMKTIMLIEDKDRAKAESVDFDDITSWEYLFKVYWVILKEKLSLTLGDLTRAKNPWKSVPTIVHKPVTSNEVTSAVSVDVPVLPTRSEILELKQLETTPPPSTEMNVEKTNNDIGDHVPAHDKDTPKPVMDEVKGETSIEKTSDEVKAEKSIEKASDVACTKEAAHESVIKKGEENNNTQVTETRCLCKNTTDNKEPDKQEIHNTNTEWATKDLLEFVAHMKNGDTSLISQFDVQTLLLDYIKKNNLRDPRRKSQIVCDQRLRNLFGKPRVGHIEMLKLLEFHFLVKEDSKKDCFIPAGLVSSSHAPEVEVGGDTHGVQVVANSRKRKACKKSDQRAPQQQKNLDEYAAIDAHNMNLVYLRCKFMENLLDGCENFSDKVIGSIVRIRISSNDQKPEIHRLVRVVGTTKVDEPYKVGGRTADFMLEVLNLDKKEVVSINAVSDQDFTEDECKRLRQSIRCGLVKHYTVGEIQNKALILQPVRVDDLLEAEISRLNHLRDRASENGRKKEYPLLKNTSFIEHVNKLQLLKSPEERNRRISEIPEVHVDPTMNPDYESEEDAGSGNIISKAEEHGKPSYSDCPPNGRKPISPRKKDKEERTYQTWNRVIKKIKAGGSSSSDKDANHVNITNSATGSKTDEVIQSSGLENSTVTASVGNSPSSSIIETEKLWHYRDPNSKIQGPFSMIQLRKWSTTGLFPPDMRIWTNHEQYDSLLLTDALNGKFHLASDSSNSGMRQEEVAPGEVEVPSEGTNGSSGGDSEQTEPPTLATNNTSENNTEPVKEDASGSWPQCWDLLKDNNDSSEVHNDAKAHDLLPSSSLENTQPVVLQDQCQENENGEKSSTGPTESPITIVQDLQNQSKNDECVGPIPSEFLKSLTIDLGLEDDIENEPVCAPPDPDNKHNASIPLSDLLLSPATSKPAEIQPDVPIHNFEILELLSPTPRPNTEDHALQPSAETKFVNFPDLNPAQVWSNPSGLGPGEVQLPGVDNDWFGYSPAPPPKPPTADAGPSAAPPNNWLTISETIEFDSLGEEYVSDLLAEVDAMESQQQGTARVPSPTAAIKFARELMEDCRDDDCFSSIEEFSRRSDALSSTTGGGCGGFPVTSGHTPPALAPPKPAVSTFDFLTRSSVHSSASSEGETMNNFGGVGPTCSGDAGSEFHPPAAPQYEVGPPGPVADGADPGWGAVQGNINLVTVQGNVNLVLGGPAGLGGGGARLLRLPICGVREKRWWAYNTDGKVMCVKKNGEQVEF